MSRGYASRRAMIAIMTPAMWIGLILGVSFLATLAKFQVPALDLGLAVNIARVTFLWLHIAEALLAVVCAVGLWAMGARWYAWSLLGLVVLLLAAQRAWIVPGFDGAAPSFFPVLSTQVLHGAFIAGEVIKCVVLAALVSACIRMVLKPSVPSEGDTEQVVERASVGATS